MERCYVTQGAQLVLCDNLECGDGVSVKGRFRREEAWVYLWLIHIVVWQKLT